jgi:hypothetical protein
MFLLRKSHFLKKNDEWFIHQVASDVAIVVGTASEIAVDIADG